MPTITKSDLDESQADSADELDDAPAVLDGDEPEDDSPADADVDTDADSEPKRRFAWKRWLAAGLLPAVTALLTLGAGFLKWQESSAQAADSAGVVALQTAKDSTVALLSYSPDTVAEDLGGARDLLTGNFRDAYTSLTNDVVIPGAQQQRISVVATVPAAALVTATENHSVVMVFVNQATTIADGAPTSTASTVKVTLDKVDGRWLISEFEPI